MLKESKRSSVSCWVLLYRHRSQEWDIFPEIGEAIQRAGLHVHMSAKGRQTVWKRLFATACSHTFPQWLHARERSWFIVTWIASMSCNTMPWIWRMQFVWNGFERVELSVPYTVAEPNVQSSALLHLAACYGCMSMYVIFCEFTVVVCFVFLMCIVTFE